jgi:hypothetical protein
MKENETNINGFVTIAVSQSNSNFCISEKEKTFNVPLLAFSRERR